MSPYSTSSPSRKNAVWSEIRTRLLHIVGDDDNSVSFFQLHGKLLDFGGGDGVQRRWWARPSAAPRGSTASARAMHSRCCWPPERPRAFFFSRSFTSSQMAARPQGLLHDLVQLGAVARCRGYGDRRRRCRRCSWGRGWASERPCRPRRRSSLTSTSGCEDVLPIVAHRRPSMRHARHQIVHAVQRLEEGGLAAAGGPDQGRDALLRDVHADVVQRLGAAVPQVQIFAP